jgi:hypothetical protein
MIPLRLVIDTNILVSAALKPDGLQRTVLVLAITKPARLYKVAGCNHLGLLPELRKMPLVAGHQVVGTGSIGALQKLVVAGVLRDLERFVR